MRRQVVFWALLLIVGMSCKSESKQNAAVETQCGDSLSATAVQSLSDLQPKNKEKAKRLGHDEIVQRLDSILHLGDNMKYDSVTGNVNLCGVEFHVNVYDGRMSLMTSVQPESRQMRILVKAIARNYGEPYIEEENTSYHWPRVLYSGVELEVPYIRIRRIHTDEGGSVMFFK